MLFFVTSCGGGSILRCSCDTVALKGRAGNNEPVFDRIMSELVGNGPGEDLSHTWEDDELSLRKCTNIVRLDNFPIKHACAV